MVNRQKRNHGRKSTHVIKVVSYEKTEENPDGVLECICGWIGRAYDRLDLFGDEKDYVFHKKTAEPIDIQMPKYAAASKAIGITPKAKTEKPNMWVSKKGKALVKTSTERALAKVTA